MTGDVELVEHLLFDAEATRGATTSWIKEEFSARRRVNNVMYCYFVTAVLKIHYQYLKLTLLRFAIANAPFVVVVFHRLSVVSPTILCCRLVAKGLRLHLLQNGLVSSGTVNFFLTGFL